MGRLVRIAIYSLIILVLYFWVTAWLKSYRKSKQLQQQEVVTADTLMRDSLALSESDSLQTTTDTLETGDAITNEQIVDDKVSYPNLDKKIETVEKKAAEDKQTKSTSSPPAQRPAKKPENVTEPIRDLSPKTNTVQPGNDGSYMVMAGSYLLKANAEKMVKKLRSMGYTKAEVVVFPQSQYHSVVAARYSSQSAANNATADLKQRGIDSFVKTR